MTNLNLGENSIAAFVFAETSHYRLLALAADPKWFDAPENQRAYLDFCTNLAYVWQGRQLQDNALAAQMINTIMPRGQAS
jgi:hypothetical protein